jgi:hypothetical protein
VSFKHSEDQLLFKQVRFEMDTAQTHVCTPNLSHSGDLVDIIMEAVPGPKNGTGVEDADWSEFIISLTRILLRREEAWQPLARPPARARSPS